MPGAREFRIALTVSSYEQSLAFYRGALGLTLVREWPSEEGRGALLELPRATLEILDEAHASWVDRMEAGRRTSGQVRFAVQFDNVAEAVASAAGTGGRLVRGPLEMPWKDLNARVLGPDGVQLTFFQRSR